MDVEIPREFAVSHDGTASILSVQQGLDLIGCPPAVSAAYDILTDDGMPGDKAAELAVAAHRGGRDAEAFARHVVKLRKAMRK